MIRNEPTSNYKKEPRLVLDHGCWRDRITGEYHVSPIYEVMRLPNGKPPKRRIMGATCGVKIGSDGVLRITIDCTHDRKKRVYRLDQLEGYGPPSPMGAARVGTYATPRSGPEVKVDTWYRILRTGKVGRVAAVHAPYVILMVKGEEKPQVLNREQVEPLTADEMMAADPGAEQMASAERDRVNRGTDATLHRWNGASQAGGVDPDQPGRWTRSGQSRPKPKGHEEKVYKGKTADQIVAERGDLTLMLAGGHWSGKTGPNGERCPCRTCATRWGTAKQ